MQFADRNEALHWIIQNQLGRRNLSAYDRSILALKLKPVIAAKAKENQGERNDLNIPQIFAESQEEPLPTVAPQEQKKIENDRETNAQVAQAAGVSRETIRKVEKIEAQASPEIKAALRTGDMSINQAFKAVKNAEKTQRQEETRERKTYTPTTELPTDNFKLIRADIRDGVFVCCRRSIKHVGRCPQFWGSPTLVADDRQSRAAQSNETAETNPIIIRRGDCKLQISHLRQTRNLYIRHAPMNLREKQVKSRQLRCSCRSV